jgi:hypothetical protein
VAVERIRQALCSFCFKLIVGGIGENPDFSGFSVPRTSIFHSRLPMMPSGRRLPTETAVPPPVSRSTAVSSGCVAVRLPEHDLRVFGALALHS